MTLAKTGDTVRIHYTGRLTNGTQFDSSQQREPLEVRLGAGEIIAGLESEVVGMEVGSSATITIAAKNAYGERDPQRVQAVPREQISGAGQLEAGQQLQATTSDGRVLPLTIVEVNEQSVTVDGNHPLAGKDLVFDIELLEIVKAA